MDSLGAYRGVTITDSEWLSHGSFFLWPVFLPAALLIVGVFLAARWDAVRPPLDGSNREDMRRAGRVFFGLLAAFAMVVCLMSNFMTVTPTTSEEAAHFNELLQKEEPQAPLLTPKELDEALALDLGESREFSDGQTLVVREDAALRVYPGSEKS